MYLITPNPDKEEIGKNILCCASLEEVTQYLKAALNKTEAKHVYIWKLVEEHRLVITKSNVLSYQHKENGEILPMGNDL